MKSPPQILSVALLLGVLLYTPPPGRNHQSKKSGRSYNIGFSKRTFFNMSVQDGKAAVKLIALKVLEIPNLDYSPKVTVFDNLESLKRIIKKDDIDLIALTSPDYYVLKNEIQLFPFCVPVFFNKTLSKFVLLANNNGESEDLEKLKNKRITVFANSKYKNIYPLLWIDNLLLKKFGQTSGSFFSEIKVASNVSDVILPVFFNKYDACIVTQGMFDIQSELNPQVGNNLKIIEESGEYVVAVFCFTSDRDKELNEKILNAFLTLHKTKQGNQLLSLFRVDKLIPFREEYLKNMGKLIKENNELKRIYKIGKQ
ncbi:MAG: PhnD/SsuA/transferrin family substrate-binding protein [Ignavibacteria bacterium]|jgi:hypothetical protein